MAAKRIAKYLAIPLIFLVGLFAVSEEARAIIPLIFGIGLVTGIETGGATALVASVAVHIAAAGLIFWNASNNSTAPPTTTPVISVQLNDAPLPAPSGWTTSTDPANPNPTPPTTVPAITSGPPSSSYFINIGPPGNAWSCNMAPVVLTGSSMADLASQAQTYLYPCGFHAYVCGGDEVSKTFNCSQTMSNEFNVGGTASLVASPSSCPVGTHPNSVDKSICIVDTPSVVPLPADGKCQIMKVGGTFQTNSIDPDCNDSTKFDPSYISYDKSTLTVTSTDGLNQTKAKANSDGTTTVTTYKDNGDGTVTTTTTGISAKPGTGGANTPSVTGTATSTGTGTIASVSGSGTSSSNGTGTGLDMPTDYNRESTQGKILDAIKQNGIDMGPLTKGWDTSTIPTTNPSNDALKTAQDGFVSTINGYLPSSWSGMADKGIQFFIPAELQALFSQQCSPWVFTIRFSGTENVMDLTKFQDIFKSIFGFFCWFWTVIELIRIFSPKED